MKRSILLIAIVGLLGLTLHVLSSFAERTSSQTRTQVLVQEVLGSLVLITRAVEEVNDEATAEEARRKIAIFDELNARLQVLRPFRSDENPTRPDDGYESSYRELLAQFLKQHDALLTRNPEAYALIENTELVRSIQTEKIREAAGKARRIQEAFHSWTRTWCGRIDFPIDLLIEGDRPVLKGGKAAITDPWGRGYKYLLEPLYPTGDEMIVVFTSNPYPSRREEIRWPPRSN